MAAAHDLADPLLRVPERVLRWGLDHYAVQARMRVVGARHRRIEGPKNLPVERDPEHTALCLEDADHGERKTVDPDLAADRVEMGKELARCLGTDDHHRRASRIFLGGEHPALRDLQVLDREEVGRHRLDQVLRATPRERGPRRVPPRVVQRPPHTRRQDRPDGLGVLDGDLRTLLPLPPRGVRHVTSIDVREAAQVERVDAEELAAEILFDVSRHPADDRYHANEKHDAHGDAEEREEASEFLGSNLRERQANRVENQQMIGAEGSIGTTLPDPSRFRAANPLDAPANGLAALSACL